MRIRVTFAKTEAMRFTSHLDMHRAWERAFRRAGLPLAYTQGFRPHPRLNLASALPLGFTSEGEVLDAWLEQPVPTPDIQKVLELKLPPGLRMVTIQEIDLHVPSLQAELIASEYTLTLFEPALDLSSRLEVLLASEHLIREWRDKSYDLRPLIVKLSVLPEDNQGLQRFQALLTARAGSTGRPDEVVAVLGLSPGKVRVHRNRLVFSQ
jgi:radical SAM-linked protein